MFKIKKFPFIVNKYIYNKKTPIDILLMKQNVKYYFFIKTIINLIIQFNKQHLLYLR